MRSVDPRNATESVPCRALSHLIDYATVLLGAADFFEGVEAGEDEFDAGGADGGVAGGVDFEGFVPEGGDAFEAFGVVFARERVANFDFDAAAEDFGDFGEAVLFDVFVEDDADGFGDRGVEDLPLP